MTENTSNEPVNGLDPLVDGSKSNGASARLLIDAQSAAAMLGISARTLWSLTNCRAIPCRRVRRRVLYSLSELEDWVASGCPTEPGSADRLGASSCREVRRG